MHSKKNAQMVLYIALRDDGATQQPPPVSTFLLPRDRWPKTRNENGGIKLVTPMEGISRNHIYLAVVEGLTRVRSSAYIGAPQYMSLI